MTVSLTRHALKRSAARGLSPQMIDAVRCFGDKVRADGSLYYFLGRRAHKRMMRVFRPDNPDAFLGLVLVCDPVSDTVITCYKNSKALKRIRDKR